MEKDIYFINENKLTYGRGYVYSLQYHIVWCTKYRRKVLTGGADDDCKKLLQEIAKEYSFRILAMEVMPDHVHVLVDAKPQFFISDMVKIMKGGIARRLFQLPTFPAASGDEGEALGRASLEPFLLCRDRQRPEQGTGGEVYREPEGKGLGWKGKAAPGPGKAAEIPPGGAGGRASRMSFMRRGCPA